MFQGEDLKAVLDFAKTVIVTGICGSVIAIAPVWINSQIQKKDLKIKENENTVSLAIAKNRTEAEIRTKIITQEMEYVRAFLDKGTEANIENRYRFTQYLASLTQDKDYKQGWLALFAAADTERKAATADLTRQEEEKANKSGEELKNAETEIARLKRELSTRQPMSQQILPITFQYSTMIEKAPCPADSQVELTVLERPNAAIEATPRTAYWFVPLGGMKTLVAVRSCIDSSRKRVGDRVAFDFRGEIVPVPPINPTWELLQKMTLAQ